MPGGVVQRLGRDAKGGDLHGGGEAGDVAAHLDAHVETRRGEAVGYGVHRLAEPQVVQGGGPQSVDDAPHGCDGPGQQRLRPGREGRDLLVCRAAAHLPDLERHSSEDGAEVVVQVAT